MDEKGKETIAAFDRLLTTNRIQMMKVFLSYLPPEYQGGLAVYIKLSELQYAMQFIRQFPGRPLLIGNGTVLSFSSLMDGSLLAQNQEGVLELLEELMPFSGPRERTYIQNLKNLLINISRMREMMAMMDMMKELFPDGMDGNGENGGFGDILQGITGSDNMTDMSGFADVISGMTGMDPSSLLQMAQMFQSTQNDSVHKSDKT